MRLPISTSSFLFLISSIISPVSAGPYPRNAAHDYNGAGYLMPRQCVSYCGMGDRYCCTAGQVCYTDAANVAICGAQTALAGAGGGWNFYTTTIVENIAVPTTKIQTLSSWAGQVPALTSAYLPQSTATCYAPDHSCGSICCKSNQFCYTDGQCKMLGENSITFASSYLTYAPGSTPTSYSAPVKGTSVATTTVPVTTTRPFVAPVQTTGGLTNLTPLPQTGGLSPGAIAGIVIGALAGVAILLFISACCCLGAGVKGIFGLLFGRKDKKRGSRTETIETRRTSTRYGGSAAASRRETHSGWFGGAAAGGRGSARTSRVGEKRHSKGKEAGTLAALGLGLAALWGGLKWKRNKDANKRRQDVSYYSYDESYTTTDSE